MILLALHTNLARREINDALTARCTDVTVQTGKRPTLYLFFASTFGNHMKLLTSPTQVQ
jgi:hypothetical protein